MKLWRHILLTTTPYSPSSFAVANRYRHKLQMIIGWLQTRHWRLVILTVPSIISICSERGSADNMHTLTQLS